VLPALAATLFMLLNYAANLCCQLGMLAFAGFEPGTAALLKSALKEIYVSNTNFINPESNFKNNIWKIKTRDVHNSKKGIHK
jgi:hypothetical protein